MPAAAGQRASSDPARDVTTIEKDGHTWQMKGSVTNVILTPPASR